MHDFLLKLWRLVPRSKALRRFLIGLIIPSYHVGVHGIVFNENREVLLFEHTYRRDQPWGLPGGFLDIHEQPAEAIVREIAEESGLVVRVERLFRVINETELRHLAIVYLCTLNGGSFTPSAEVKSTSWYTLDELPDILLIQKQLIRDALSEDDTGD